uniref:non-specific serine/threonine protein kinase n=1 Tax=Macrostomum lignano TaxID=282301 RepID=A0A1I8HYN8_9PLAT
MTLLSSAAVEPAASGPAKQQPELLQQQQQQSHEADLPATGAIPEEAFRVSQTTAKSYPHSKKVGNYLVGKNLGEGSFAKVKEGLHVVTGERVAIKIISKEKAKTDAYVRKNLRREGRILQQIRHSNVVQLLEVLETENSYYLIVELCRGGDMMDHIVKKTRLSEAETKRYIRQVVLAIDYMHKLGILHRDLKIENLLLTDNQMVKIIDFGLSNMVKTIAEGDENIVTELCKTQCGSPAYAAPEVLSHKPYGTAVDVWSIGVNMFAMLTGNLPFTVKPFNIKALCQKMLSGEINALPKDISRNCRDLLMKFLNPAPEARIKLRDVMAHPWLQEAGGASAPRLQPSPFPNRLRSGDLNPDVVRHMTRSLGLKSADIARQVSGNTPGACLATYWLLVQKAERFCRQRGIQFPPPLPSTSTASTTAASARKPAAAPLKHAELKPDGDEPPAPVAVAATTPTPTPTPKQSVGAEEPVEKSADKSKTQQSPPQPPPPPPAGKRIVDFNNPAANRATPPSAAAPTDAEETMRSRTLPLKVQRRPKSPSKTVAKQTLAAPPFLAGLYPMKETVRREASSLDLPTSREKTVLAFSTPQKERIPVFESIKEEGGELPHQHGHIAPHRFGVTNGFHHQQPQHRPSEYSVDTGQGTKVRVPANSLPEVFLRHSKIVGDGVGTGRAKTSVDMQLQSVDTTPSVTPAPPHPHPGSDSAEQSESRQRWSGNDGVTSRRRRPEHGVAPGSDGRQPE